jgi:hypothetical protein
VNENGWVKLCTNDQQTGNKQVYLISHEELEPNTGMLILSAAVRSVEGEDTQHLLIGVTTAKSLIMSVGAQIKINDGEPIALRYGICMLTRPCTHKSRSLSSGWSQHQKRTSGISRCDGGGAGLKSYSDCLVTKLS